jgi:tetratricopeptide (TPR) repeat protein
MDGRMSRWLLLGVLLTSGGCVTTQEKKVVIHTEGDTLPLAMAPKDEVKKPAPPRVLLAFAEKKERDADLIKDNPEGQIRVYDEARRIYQEILKAEPDQIEACRGLARIYGRMADYERAQESYNRALARHPRDLTLWYEQGMMHNRRKDWAAGAQCFRKALEVDPENQRCLKALGFTLARAGQLSESVSCLTRAMGSAAAAHCNVAQMLLHMSDMEPGQPRESREELARQHLRQALQADPHCERAQELLASLQTHAATPTRGSVELQFAEPVK